MTHTFYKYQGTGNDFVMIDSRRTGVGADGLILLETESDYDFKMVYFNADGNESTMCGNGGRCIVAFADFLGIINRDTRFLAIDGPHLAIIDSEHIELKMQDVSTISSNENYHLLDTGSPHYVALKSDLETIDMNIEGAKIRYSEPFNSNGVNVNFAEKINEDTFAIRTYERGVEAETLSCGTGATAVAIAMFHSKQTTSNAINLQTQGGVLKVQFEPHHSSFTEVWLCGPAKQVFKAELEW